MNKVELILNGEILKDAEVLSCGIEMIGIDINITDEQLMCIAREKGFTIIENKAIDVLLEKSGYGLTDKRDHY